MATTDTPVEPPGAPEQFPKGLGRALKRLSVGLLIGAVVLVLGAFAYLKWAEGRIDRIPGEDLASLEPVTPSVPRTFLVVGTDDAANVEDDSERAVGQPTGSRADVIMLLHFVPDRGAQLISIPRDLKVDIPGWETNQINAAFDRGGPDLLVRTIKQELDISINHYIEIGFVGFAELVGTIGGVTLDFQFAARDLESGLNADQGLVHLDAAMALAYVQSRSYEEFRDGQWRFSGDSEIGRTRRQQRLLLALLGHVTSPSRAFNLPGFVAALTDQITADEGLTAGVLLEIGRATMDLRSGILETATLPVRASTQEPSLVIAIERDSAALLNAFRDGTPYP